MSRPSHPEERYQAELLSTEVSPRTARVMAWAFVGLLVLIPVSQTLLEVARRQTPQVLDVVRPVRLLVRGWIHGDRDAARSAWRTLVSREFPKGFEDALERGSAPKSWVQPRLQGLLTGLAGFGNDKGTVGRNGWLFYQPGIDYVTGPDVTSADTLALTAKRMIDKQGEADPQPDPRAALLAFNRACERAGIHLVLVPIPDKSMLQPWQLVQRASSTGAILPANNRGYDALIAELRKEIDVFDPTPKSIAAGDERYLPQDTHWTPGFMDSVSAALAAYIAPVLTPVPTSVSASGPQRYITRPMAATRVGDLVDILKLPAEQRLYLPQTATVDQVIDTTSQQPWTRDPSAEVLVLGDSFTNVFSEAAMGWGSAAGFGPHLSLHLQRPVDVIASNGGSASAAREELARRVAGRTEPLPTRVIVYEVSMRFLAGENWRVVPFAPARRVESPATSEPKTAAAPPKAAPVAPVAPVAAIPALPPGPFTAVVEVLQTSKVPEPGTAPYKDCLTYLRLRVLTVEAGQVSTREVIGAFWAMRDNQWLPAASYAVGDRLRVTMTPMELADSAVRSMQRADSLNDFVLKVFLVSNEGKP